MTFGKLRWSGWKGFNGRLGQQELVVDGHAMTEAPLHFGRPVSLRRVSDAECLHIGQMVGMHFQDFSGMILLPGSQAISTSFRSG